MGPRWLGWLRSRPRSQHLRCVASFHSAMAKCAGPRLPLVMKALVCTQSSVYEIQRVTSTAFLAEVLVPCSDLLRAWEGGEGSPLHTGRHRPPQPARAIAQFLLGAAGSRGRRAGSGDNPTLFSGGLGCAVCAGPSGGTHQQPQGPSLPWMPPCGRQCQDLPKGHSIGSWGVAGVRNWREPREAELASATSTPRACELPGGGEQAPLRRQPGPAGVGRALGVGEGAWGGSVAGGHSTSAFSCSTATW